jgi:hypothetical protein
MTAQVIKLPWHPPKVRVLDWPTLYLPFNNYIIIKDGIEFTFHSIPIVTVSDNKADNTDKASNTEVLFNVIRRKFRSGETFLSRQLEKDAETDEELRAALGDNLDDIGTLLREIRKAGNLKIRNADGTIDDCCIEVDDYERHVASWTIKVSPSRD